MNYKNWRTNLGYPSRIMIVYGDGPLLRPETLQRLIAQQTGGDSAATLLTAEMADPTGYGRVLRDARGRVVGVVEQKAATPEQLAMREANMGIYCYPRGPLLEARGRIADR